nr:immunoglobulin light chain junction region [Macaca mulatta]MOY09200.1 immunoglobulin light chain junction region [Macaca mulatta]MOY10298.1 immunoglobulin light chain junction region [Macaca mulatta]
DYYCQSYDDSLNTGLF